MKATVVGCVRGCDLAHDAEELERVDRAHDQVVVGVLAVVEVEAAEEPFGQEERDDLLDVRPLRMVPRVDQDLSLRAEAAADERCGAPIGKVRAVEAGLEELVLDQEPHIRRKQRVELLERCGQAPVPVAKVVLPGIVRPVGEPEADRRRAELLGDLDALSAVGERLRANALVGMAEASQPVVVIAEEVGVDRADPDALLLGVASQRAPVVDPVPGDVKRDGRTAAGESVHERRIIDPLPDGARGTRPGVDVEARPGVAVAPRRRLDREAGELLEEVVFLHRASLTHG